MEYGGMNKQPVVKMPKETEEQVRHRYARAILRAIHPTVAPFNSDVRAIAEILKQFRAEVARKGRKS